MVHPSSKRSRRWRLWHGPPILKAIKALEAVAVDMSKAISMKFSHKCLPYPSQSNTRDWDAYLKNMERIYVDCYEPVRLISDGQQQLGEYDFFFEWSEKPNMGKIEDLLGKIDEALKGLGCRYTITTK
jgi:hypothetical protein